MDWSHFGLARPAFRSAIDTDSYFPSAGHEIALATVASGFARRDSVVLLDGNPGVGKSLVARQWLEQLLPDVPRAVIPNVHAARPNEFLQAILFDLSEPYQGLSEQELRLSVTGHLLQASAVSGFPTVLLIDEAQHLTSAALEELRLLGNIETRHGTALFTILVAQPMLRDALQRPAFEAIAQRIAVRVAVEPITEEEAIDYLFHQIQAAGGDPDAVFDEGAAPLIAAACGGVPRLLNQVAGLAASLAADAGAETIDLEAAMEAISRLGLELPESDDSAEPDILPHPARSSELGQTIESKGAGSLNAKNQHQPVAGKASKQKAARKRSA